MCILARLLSFYITSMYKTHSSCFIGGFSGDEILLAKDATLPEIITKVMKRSLSVNHLLLCISDIEMT